MDTHTDHSGEYAPSWNPLRWLGLSRSDAQAAPEAAIHAAGSPSQQQLHMAEIARFLDQHGLPVATVTLNIAWTYLTRGDEDLVLALDRRIRSGRGLTLEWLQDIHQRREISGEAVELRELMQRLEASVEEFGKSTREAHGAASEYHSALSGQIGELEQVAKASAVITEMAQIGKAMLRRTHEIERQMLRSSAQTRALKRRLDEARKESEEDHLTGLPNRRAFEVVLEEQVHLARSGIEVMSVAFCDIDHFKHVNDRHGHETGDRVLREIAATLARLTNDRCHVARHGGEEFVMLFRGLDKHAAGAKLDGVRDTLSQRRFVNRKSDEPIGQITFSAGVADVFAYPSPREALRAADQALYAAKQHGRNTVVIAP